jgi:hypothetical protein
MPKQVGPIKFAGTLGDLTYYKKDGEYFVKSKSEIPASRIASEPEFRRVRENNEDFKTTVTAAQLLSSVIREQSNRSYDNKLYQRAFKRCRAVLEADLVNPRGTRTVADGDLYLFEGFEFNRHASLGLTLELEITPAIDRVAGELEISLPAYIPEDKINPPQDATHFKVVAIAAEVDFAANEMSAVSQASAFVPLNGTATAPLTLTCAVTPASTKPLFLIAGIEFYKNTPAANYLLNNGAHNAFTILKIDA